MKALWKSYSVLINQVPSLCFMASDKRLGLSSPSRFREAPFLMNEPAADYRMTGLCTSDSLVT
jgi:hypothetical protein